MGRPHAVERKVSDEGRALMKSLKDKLKASADKRKTASHYLSVDPKHHSVVLREKKPRRSATTYKKMRIRAASKLVATWRRL
jgi:hypothetical protein